MVLWQAALKQNATISTGKTLEGGVVVGRDSANGGLCGQYQDSIIGQWETTEHDARTMQNVQNVKTEGAK